MTLTLGITGMDRATEAAVQAAFKAANTEIGGVWTLVSAEAADFVIIDLDSLYGPMSLLKLHAAGRKTIGLTSVTRSQTNYRLAHPISANDLAVLLSEIATDLPTEEAAAEAKPDIAAPLETAAEPVLAPAPAPEPKPEPEPDPEPSAPAQYGLQHWLASGQLRQRARLQSGDAPVLLIDPTDSTWYGSNNLKPLTPYFESAFDAAAFQPIDDIAWAAETHALGEAQPIARLHWLGGLLSGAAVEGPYVLHKWPQTEREYPRHFRIATVMMKGPATAEAIAEASHVSIAEVVDFINANLATGNAEPAAAPPTSDPPPKPQGFFGRLRSH